MDATAEDLAALGVTSWKLNADIYETDPELGTLLQQRWACVSLLQP